MTTTCGSNGPWEGLQRIWWIIGELRGQSGCPWDRKQTPEKVQTYLVEEAHEAAAAVRGGRVQEVAEELGDLLFMVFFMVHLYHEAGHFGLEEVCKLTCEKMIRRHPHVFGDVRVASSEEVKGNWERIKEKEKTASGKPAGKVPDSLPALVRAHRILSRLSHRDAFAGNDLESARSRFAGRSEELSRLLSQSGEVPPELFGALLLDVVNLARVKGFRAEDCLHEQLAGLEDS